MSSATGSGALLRVVLRGGVPAALSRQHPRYAYQPLIRTGALLRLNLRKALFRVTACAPLAGFGSAVHVVHRDGFVLNHDTDDTLEDATLPVVQRLSCKLVAFSASPDTTLR